MDSNTSSPRPSELDLDDHQRSQDAALAHSMANASARTRSNTIHDRDHDRDRDRDMVTPQRGPRGRHVGSSPPRGASDPDAVQSSAARRRGSVGQGASYPSYRGQDHLADDLEIQNRVDQQSAVPDRSQRFTPHSMHSASALGGSAAAARFYRQNRNMSDSSIDSQGGAYIDHRRQPHSLSIATASRSGGGNAGERGPLVRSPVDYSGRPGNEMGSARRQASGDDSRGRQDDDGDMGAYRSNSPGSPSHPRGEEPGDSYISTNSNRTQRQHSGNNFTSADLDEDAIVLDEGGPPPRGHLERHLSSKSYASLRSNQRRGSFTNEMSRRGSMDQVEEDVCFPAHGAAAEVDLLDLGMSSMYGLHPEEVHNLHNGGMGVPGVLHNFPFPFDFSALQEYADQEKQGIPISKKRRGTAAADASSPSTSPPGYGTSMRSRLGLSSSSEGEGRRTMRQRKLSESVAPGRYQKNLALFEDAGEEAVPSSRTFTTILDTKTPLLSGTASAPAGYGSNAKPGAPPASSSAARPYRFSFYSNALPSTIHARSLAEIPADGQTFEELFSGHTAAEYDESIPGATTFSPHSSSQAGVAETGTTTPISGFGPSTNGARPAGIPAHLGAGKKLDRPRSSMVRTDVDAEANTWWLDVLCPTDQEMKVLSKVFGIHPLTTEDIQMEETREKIELFRNYYFVCFRSFEQDPYSPTYLEPLNMYIIVFREGTLSFHFRGTPHPQNVRRRIKQLKDYINVTSDWISYALIDDITDAFGPLIQNIEYEVDSIDELVLILKEAEQSDMLRRIGTCRKKVMGLLRLMGNKADVVKGLSKRCNENWSVAPKSDIGLYLSDIQDHITTSTQNLTHYEKILSRSHSNYLAQISIEMTDANNQINDVLSKLTALGTVLIPMNLITGLWGMNVHVPGQDVENLHWFFGIIGSLAAIAMGGAWLTYRVFVRQ
ncbi:CorA family metal ion transporter [Pseudohyphozyma bogoriensis]|nr:CorA family metal ion transporter [Pseudohyphozyma bogoriensis]